MYRCTELAMYTIRSWPRTAVRSWPCTRIGPGHVPIYGAGHVHESDAGHVPLYGAGHVHESELAMYRCTELAMYLWKVSDAGTY